MRRALPLSLLFTLGACLQPVGDPDGAGGDAGPAAVDAGCGNPQEMARFWTCQATRDAPSCEQAGGRWTTAHSGFTFCVCPTGQAGCPCDRASQCILDCLAEIPGSEFDHCQFVTSGTCEESDAVLGCWCTFGSGPPATWMCRD